MSNVQPGERFHILAQLEHLQSKFTGTGHSDVTRHEWIVNQHRDTLASMIGKSLVVFCWLLGDQCEGLENSGVLKASSGW